VTDVVVLNSARGELLSLAAAIESRSEHPLGDAIVRKAKEKGLSVPEVAEFESVTGIGARARVNGNLFKLKMAYYLTPHLGQKVWLSPSLAVH